MKNTYSYSVIHKSGWGIGFGPRPTHCHTCGAELPGPKPGSGAVGYGCGERELVKSHPAAPELKHGETLARSPAVCYACCAAADKADMIATGRALLYLTHAPGADLSGGRKAYGRTIDCTVSNWPGSLPFHGRAHIGRHNMARVRYDVSFIGPDGLAWRGTTYGDNTQICHCRRLSNQKRG